MKFVDWIKERPKAEDAIKAYLDIDLNVYEENALMFISISLDGKVIISDITVVGWGVTYADDRILVNP